MDEFCTRFSAIWQQMDVLAPPPCPHTFTCTLCIPYREHELQHRMYEFIMRLRPEFEATFLSYFIVRLFTL